MSDDTKVKVVGLTKKFGDLLVLNDISSVSYTHLTLPTKLEV